MRFWATPFRTWPRCQVNVPVGFVGLGQLPRVLQLPPVWAEENAFLSLPGPGLPWACFVAAQTAALPAGAHRIARVAKPLVRKIYSGVSWRSCIPAPLPCTSGETVSAVKHHLSSEKKKLIKLEFSQSSRNRRRHQLGPTLSGEKPAQAVGVILGRKLLNLRVLLPAISVLR